MVPSVLPTLKIVESAGSSFPNDGALSAEISARASRLAASFPSSEHPLTYKVIQGQGDLNGEIDGVLEEIVAEAGPGDLWRRQN